MAASFYDNRNAENAPSEAGMGGYSPWRVAAQLTDDRKIERSSMSAERICQMH